MILFLISLILGALSQAILFVGWPIPLKNLRLRHIREGVLAFINEQSLWLMTLIYWYLLWRHSLIPHWSIIVVSGIMTGFVAVAAFSRVVFSRLVSLLFYTWYLLLDLYICLVFLIRSPSNIFIQVESKTIVDYYFFGMVLVHLIALLDFVFNNRHQFHFESRYKDRQVTALYPFATTVIVLIVLLVLPRFFPISDFAFVGGLLGIGTWATGQRSGNQKVGMKPKMM
jgi:hypothetical protein